MKHIRLLSILLLHLAIPLCAKCPNNFVELHGKVACAFKPDYKSISHAYLFHTSTRRLRTRGSLGHPRGDDQRRNRVSTFTSYNPLTGAHNCARRPTGVLVRLIAADGTEWDRKEMKIADAFRYDESQGQYTVRAELILHGWCEQKCADTLSAPCGNPK